MRLGIVSDSHGHMELTRPAVRMLESLEVERVLHCGDIGSVEVAAMFAPWPTDFVLGNCDCNLDELGAGIAAAGLTFHSEFADLEFAGKRVALLHSHDQRKFQQVICSGEYDLVCYGHTHVAKIEQHGATLVVNPGALYRANPHSLAVVELPEMAATIVEL
jgi:putative phosphoesterase